MGPSAASVIRVREDRATPDGLSDGSRSVSIKGGDRPIQPLEHFYLNEGNALR